MNELSREKIVARIEKTGLMAIIRSSSSSGLVETCRALHAGGVTVAEITMNTPGVIETIRAVADELGHTCLIGVGSVLDADSVHCAVDAGAQFVVSPVFKSAVIDAAHAAGKPVIPGCLTPTEIYAACEAGGDFIKVFPANCLGPAYLKDVLAPMPDLKLIPVGGGGATLDMINEWFANGARCLGIGSTLVKKDLIAKKDWRGLTSLARQFVKKVEAAPRNP